MQATPIHETMAQQIDHVRPRDLVPGQTIGIEIRDENSITVICPTLRMRAVVEYLPGHDLYALEILRDDEIKAFDRVYCDQLGELIFGEAATPWTLPMGGIVTADENGNVVIEEF